MYKVPSQVETNLNIIRKHPVNLQGVSFYLKPQNSMKQLVLLFVLLTTFNFVNAQYSETFDTAEKGILTSPCTTNDPTSCVSFDFTGVDWTIEGDLSGLDALPSLEDDFKTSGGVFTSAGDVDEELCWVGPILDISTAGSDVDFNCDVSYTGFDASDFLDVEYRIDGGAWQIAQEGLIGPAGHTISGAGTGSSNDVGITGGLSGSTLQIRVCVDFNSQTENFTLDNVNVPDANVMLLPVTLVDFSAKPIANQEVMLEWVTASELNNSHFEIQRSSNGVDFTVIGEAEGRGTVEEITYYDFVDAMPYAGINYYRLKQIDFDGKFEYSEVIPIEFDGLPKGEVRISPNPFENTVVLEFETETGNDFYSTRFIELFDLYGKRIQVWQIQADAAIKTLDLSHLSSGAYILRTQVGSQSSINQRIVKL